MIAPNLIIPHGLVVVVAFKSPEEIQALADKRPADAKESYPGGRVDALASYPEDGGHISYVWMPAGPFDASTAMLLGHEIGHSAGRKHDKFGNWI